MVRSNTNRKNGKKNPWCKPLDKGLIAGTYYCNIDEQTPDVDIRKGSEYLDGLLGKSFLRMFVMDWSGNYMAMGRECRNYLRIPSRDIVNGRASIITNIEDVEPLLEAFFGAKSGKHIGSRVRVRGSDNITRALDIGFTSIAFQDKDLLVGTVSEHHRMTGAKKGGS